MFGWPLLYRINRRIFNVVAQTIGLNYFVSRNRSEKSVIVTLIRTKTAPVVFDIGANIGDWSKMVLSINPTTVLHAFEPQSKLYENIVTLYPDIIANNIAISDRIGTLDLYDYEISTGSQHASLQHGVIELIHKQQSRKISVRTTTIDEYCRVNSITFIDLIKVDIEGSELVALRGAANMIRNNSVGAIQFEFNSMNILSRSFFYDFQLILSNNYILYRLLPHGVIELDDGPHWLNEQFTYQNILAVQRDRHR